MHNRTDSQRMRAIGCAALLVFLWMNAAEGLNASADTAPIFGEKRILDHQGQATSGPAIQLDSHGMLHLAWIEQGTDALAASYVQSTLEDDVFPVPQRVNPPNLPVSSLHAPPALAVGQNGDIYLTWTSPHPNANGTPFSSLLQLSRSLDHGATFLPPVQVNDDDVVTGHSFDHLEVSPDGSIHIAWIDAREGKKNPATYTARSRDRGRHLTSNLKVDDNTCVCCRSTVATSPDGTVYIAWRKIFAGDVREAVVARSTNDGQTYSSATIVGHDQWVFSGCPHRPASMGVDNAGRLYIVWYTEGPDDTPGIYLAYSDDQGRTFTPRRRLNHSTGTFPDHPHMAVDTSGRIVVIWEEQSPVRKEIVMSMSLDRGNTFSQPRKINSRKAKHPAVAVNNHGTAVLAWSEQVTFPHWSTVLQPLSLPASAVPRDVHAQSDAD